MSSATRALGSVPPTVPPTVPPGSVPPLKRPSPTDPVFYPIDPKFRLPQHLQERVVVNVTPKQDARVILKQNNNPISIDDPDVQKKLAEKRDAFAAALAQFTKEEIIGFRYYFNSGKVAYVVQEGDREVVKWLQVTDKEVELYKCAQEAKSEAEKVCGPITHTIHHKNTLTIEGGRPLFQKDQINSVALRKLSGASFEKGVDLAAEHLAEHLKGSSAPPIPADAAQKIKERFRELKRKTKDQIEVAKVALKGATEVNKEDLEEQLRALENFYRQLETLDGYAIAMAILIPINQDKHIQERTNGILTFLKKHCKEEEENPRSTMEKVGKYIFDKLGGSETDVDKRVEKMRRENARQEDTEKYVADITSLLIARRYGDDLVRAQGINTAFYNSLALAEVGQNLAHALIGYLSGTSSAQKHAGCVSEYLTAALKAKPDFAATIANRLMNIMAPVQSSKGTVVEMSKSKEGEDIDNEEHAEALVDGAVGRSRPQATPPPSQAASAAPKPAEGLDLQRPS